MQAPGPSLSLLLLFLLPLLSPVRAALRSPAASASSSLSRRVLRLLPRAPPVRRAVNHRGRRRDFVGLTCTETLAPRTRWARKSMWEDEMPMGDFSELNPQELREFKKKMQISDKEWAEMGLPKVEDERKVETIERTEDDEKLDQQAFQYVISKLKEFRSQRDMGPVELKLVLMAGLDARDAAQMTYEDEEQRDDNERSGIIYALEEIIETGKIPADRESLRQLATELAQMPIVDPENKTRKMKKISAKERGIEYVEEKKNLSPREVGGVAAVWGVTAVPVIIGLTALWILYTSSGTQVQ